MEFEKLPKERVKIIESIIINGSPNFISEKPWLSVYPFNPKEIIDNLIFLNKVVAVAVLISGSSAHPVNNLYSYDIIRKDGDIFDVDRYLLSVSGLDILRKREIEKDFPEHHLSEIPHYYR